MLLCQTVYLCQKKSAYFGQKKLDSRLCGLLTRDPIVGRGPSVPAFTGDRLFPV